MKVPHIVLRRAGSTARVGRGLGASSGWAVAGVLAVALAGGAAVAAAGDSEGAPGKTATEKSAAAKFGPRVQHGEATVKTRTGEYRSVLVQRGAITAVDPDSMTLRSADGFVATWTLTDATRVRSERRSGDLADLTVGDTVGVAGTGSGNEGTAKVVRDKS
ncbi:hypothetical protein [Sporichthya sp.]|uniref:hypothetical protein n=1 Tax=Sporichthya sp. TaxID=65475 RepID=UPI0017B01E1E|nr:hypothetical protein [Sporichthya sp.]MBA3743604.1 hypothetical protein [Sporichthya sp.]